MHKNVLCVIDIANPKLSGDALLQRASALSTIDQAQLYVLTVAPDLTGGLAGSFLNQGPLKELFDQATKMTHDFRSADRARREDRQAFQRAGGCGA